MKVCTWNVNGIRARKDMLKEFLERERPDIVCVQENKGNTQIVEEVLQDMKPYEVQCHCVDSKHGSSIIYNTERVYLIKPILLPPDLFPGNRVTLGFYMSGDTPMIIGSLYINQGQDLTSPEYPAKMRILNNLITYIKALKDIFNVPVILAGDYNIAPTDDFVWSAENWHSGIVTCTPKERVIFAKILEKLELQNTYDVEIAGPKFSWYGYRQFFRKNNKEGDGRYGIRIDHILYSGGECNYSECLWDYRMTGDLTPSDHLPVVSEIAFKSCLSEIDKINKISDGYFTIPENSIRRGFM